MRGRFGGVICQRGRNFYNGQVGKKENTVSFLSRLFGHEAPPIDPSLRLVALGGIERVGGPNCHLLETPELLVMLDCGAGLITTASGDGNVTANESDDAGADADENGREYNKFLFPDFSYLKGKLGKRFIILLSHGHLDHIAGIWQLFQEFYNPGAKELKRPLVVGSDLTIEVLKRFFADRGQVVFPFTTQVISRNEHYDQYEIAGLRIRPFFVPHSIPEALGFWLEIGGKRVVYMGDWKSRGSDWPATIQFHQELKALPSEPDILLLDATNAQETGIALSEGEVWKQLNRLISNSWGRVVFTTFSSHADRLEAVIRIARGQRRPVYAVGKNLLYYLKQRVAGGWKELPFRFNPPRNALILVTGAQAEENSVLVRLANRRGPFSLRLNDTVIISADPIPIPEVETRVEKLIKSLLTSVNRVYINEDCPPFFPPRARRARVHATGHAQQGESLELVKRLAPKLVAPVHGDPEKRQALASAVEVIGVTTLMLETGKPVVLAD